MARGTRANIPTGKLAEVVAARAAPVFYATDPSLDPQLVWRGRDAQDSPDLSVPGAQSDAQEKVVHRAIVEDLSRGRSGWGW